MTDCHLGIDPGLDGGFFVISHDGGGFKLKMPTIKIEKEDGSKKRELDRAGILSFLKRLPAGTRAVIEEQHPVRKQNITSICTTCKNYGILLMALSAAKINTTEVPSQVWQTHAGIHPQRKGESKTTKQQAEEICKRLHPEADLRGSPKAHEAHSGITDALLIAHYSQFLAEGETL